MAGHRDQGFGRRVRKIEKQHRRLAQGYVTSVNHDGLVVARVRRSGFRFPFRGILLLVIAFLGFKSFLYANSGEIGYAERLALMQQGTIAERAGAWVMQPDVVTMWIGDTIKGYLVK
jgi:hypothetical protein